MLKLTKILGSESKVGDIYGYVRLTMLQRTKARLKVDLENGEAAGLFLPRGQLLKQGSLLQSDEGVVVQVIAADETVSTASSDDLTLLAKGCYHLGNRHVPLQVEQGWCRYQHDHVLDDMLIGLGLKVVVEKAPFQPEPGAYGGTTGGHSHSHGDEAEYVHPHEH